MYHPLTRFAATPLSTLSHIRAFTLVFDKLWGEGKSAELADPESVVRFFGQALMSDPKDRVSKDEDLPTLKRL